jgi:hypothetical protein
MIKEELRAITGENKKIFIKVEELEAGMAASVHVD